MILHFSHKALTPEIPEFHKVSIINFSSFCGLILIEITCSLASSAFILANNTISHAFEKYLILTTPLMLL
jgi:hypothetical protein